MSIKGNDSFLKATLLPNNIEDNIRTIAISIEYLTKLGRLRKSIKDESNRGKINTK